jgi:hypothetical protein
LKKAMMAYRTRHRDGGETNCPSFKNRATPATGRAGGRFIMLGVLHRDPQGPDLLDRWLARIGPQVITLEFSNYGMRFRAEAGPGYIRRIEEVYNRLKKDNVPCYDNALSMVRSYVEMPYEFKGASQYGREQGIPVYLIDMDLFSSRRLREAEKLLSEENLEKVLSEDMESRKGYETVLAKLYFEKGVKTVTYTDEMRVRDKYMSNKIAVLRQYHKEKRLLHICGWQHLQDPYDLYSSENPEKVFIYDKARCI